MKYKNSEISIFRSPLILMIMEIKTPFVLTSFISNMALVLFNLALLGLVVMLIYGLTFRFSSKSIAKKMGVTKYQISHEGIRIEHETRTIFQKWSGISSIEQNNDLIFLFVSGMVAHIIPKRCFENQDQIKLFVAEVYEYKYGKQHQG